jgi:hypothetical protein
MLPGPLVAGACRRLLVGSVPHEEGIGVIGTPTVGHHLASMNSTHPDRTSRDQRSAEVRIPNSEQRSTREWKQLLQLRHLEWRDSA